MVVTDGTAANTTYTKLFDFPSAFGVGTDPFGALVQDANGTFYGTTQDGAPFNSERSSVHHRRHAGRHQLADDQRWLGGGASGPSSGSAGYQTMGKRANIPKRARGLS